MEQAIAFLQQLSDKLGATGSALFSIYAQKIFAEGVADLGFAVVGAGILFFGVPRVIAFFKAIDDEFASIMGGMFGGIAVIVLSIMVLVAIHQGIIEVIAPAGVAVERIVTAGKH